MKKIPLIVIVGPTAVGKTKLSIEIAKKYNCEIISCDSVQIYKKFNIGSAKIKEEEKQGIIHHLIDELEPLESFSVADFQILARKKITDIYNKGKIPLLVGGTGYYVNSILYDYNFLDININIDENYEYMLDFLKKNRLDIYNNIDIKNKRRVTNAYKFLIANKKDYLENKPTNKLFSNYNPHIIVLDLDRNKLYERINERVDIMMKDGLLLEVENIVKNYGLQIQPLSAIGYKEIISYLNEEISLDDAIEKIKQHSRRYAKRQLTWFRNKMNANWYNIEKENFKNIEKDINIFLEESL